MLATLVESGKLLSERHGPGRRFLVHPDNRKIGAPGLF
jgi:hypothetical protein